MSTAFLFNNKMMKYGTHAMGISSSPTPPGPVLPANTVRVRTSNGSAPVKVSTATYETATLVEGTTDVYDVYKSGTSFDHLLYQSTNLVEVIGANLTGITRTDYMFYRCTALTTVNNILNTSAVENTSEMFDRCSALTAVPLFDTSSVTDISYMFARCSNLTTVPLFDTSSATNMACMFYQCSSLTTVPLFDTSSVTEMGNMFDKCSSLTTVPLFDTSSATDMDYMFNDCSSLTAIPLFDTSSLQDMDYMFYRCYNVESGALALYNQASTQTTPPSSHMSTFGGCGRDTVTGAAELAQIPSSWGGTGA